VSDCTTVWLIRHGTPDGAEGRCYGRYDIPLSSAGIEQAGRLASRLEVERLARVYASPLRRALDTARIIAESHDVPVEPAGSFVEIHFGDFEGLTYDEIQARFPEAFQLWMEQPANVQFPNGECFQDMRVRVLRAMDSVVAYHPAESVAIVTHAGVIRLLIAEALSIPHSQIFRLAQDYAALNRIDYFDHGPVVQLMNSQPDVVAHRI